MATNEKTSDLQFCVGGLWALDSRQCYHSIAFGYKVSKCSHCTRNQRRITIKNITNLLCDPPSPFWRSWLCHQDVDMDVDNAKPRPQLWYFATSVKCFDYAYWILQNCNLNTIILCLYGEDIKTSGCNFENCKLIICRKIMHPRNVSCISHESVNQN